MNGIVLQQLLNKFFLWVKPKIESAEEVVSDGSSKGWRYLTRVTAASSTGVLKNERMMQRMKTMNARVSSKLGD